MVFSPNSAGRSIGMIALTILAATALGGEVNVIVVDRDGLPVADVAVYASKPGPKLPDPADNAVMDQVGKQFVPNMLVVQTGTSVEFPNSDTVAHHVYSFSHPNKFMLPMYKGVAHPPVTFEHSGIVTLGCNIHDHMLGYILVVDSANFTKTDNHGKATLSLEGPQDYKISIWSPRIRDGEELLSKTVAQSDDAQPTVNFRLARKLNPAHGTQSVAWQEY